MIAVRNASYQPPLTVFAVIYYKGDKGTLLDANNDCVILKPIIKEEYTRVCGYRAIGKH